MDQVQCRECGKSFFSLGAHLGPAHGLTSKQYRQKYPGAEVLAMSHSRRMSQSFHSREPRAESAYQAWLEGSPSLRALQQRNAERMLAQRLELYGWPDLDTAVRWARANGMTVSTLAKRLGVSPRFIARRLSP